MTTSMFEIESALADWTAALRFQVLPPEQVLGPAVLVVDLAPLFNLAQVFPRRQMNELIGRGLDLLLFAIMAEAGLDLDRFRNAVKAGMLPAVVTEFAKSELQANLGPEKAGALLASTTALRQIMPAIPLVEDANVLLEQFAASN